MKDQKDTPKINLAKLSGVDLRKETVAKLKAVWPALFGDDGSLNQSELTELVSGFADDRKEKFSFTWAGKTLSKKIAFAPVCSRLEPDDKASVEPATTGNAIIEGENLEALKLLLAPYASKVKCIYIDPPYNTGHDFVYTDKYADKCQTYWEKSGVTEDGIKVDTNTESAGRFHSEWLCMMQARLLLARQLLREDGVIFVSIDDNEVHNLRKLMDEVFGEEGFVASFIWEKRTTRENRKEISINHDYVLVYSKGVNGNENLLNLLPLTKDVEERYLNPDDDIRGSWQSVSLNAQAGHATPSQFYEITTPNGRIVSPPTGRCWSVTKEKFEALVKENRIWFGEDGGNVPRRKVFLSELIPSEKGLTPHTFWSSLEAGTNDSAKKELIELFSGVAVFDTPKPVQLIKRIIQLSTSIDGVVCDFFAGSGATAHAVMELNKEDGGNRKFILVQIPELTDEKSEAYKAGYKKISDITAERVRRAGARIKAEASKDGTTHKVDVGFRMFRLKPSLFPETLFRLGMTEEESVAALQAYFIESQAKLLSAFDPDDLLYEIMVKEGFGLHANIAPDPSFKKNKILRITDGDLTALFCFEEKIQQETVNALIATHKTTRFVCLHRALGTPELWTLSRELGENLAVV